MYPNKRERSSKIPGKTQDKLWLYYGSFILLLLYVTLFYLNLTKLNLTLFFDSDLLYLPALYKDIFVDGNSFSGWKLPPAPYFFYDMPLYFLLNYLTKNFLHATYIYGILQFIVSVVLFQSLLIRIIKKVQRADLSVMNILGCFLIASTLISEKAFLLMRFMFLPSVHTSSFLSALFCLLLAIEYFEKGGRLKLILIFVISTLAIISDKIFIIMFCVPLFITTAIFFWRKKQSKPVGILSGTAMASLLLGALFYKSGLEIVKQIPSAPSGDIISSFAALLNDFVTYLVMDWSVLLTVSSFGCFSILIWRILKSKNREINENLFFYSYYFLSYTVILIVASVLKGVYQDVFGMRYTISAVIFLTFNIGVVYSLYINNKTATIKYISGLLLAVAIVFVRNTPIREKYRSLTNYYPEETRFLDDLSEKNGIKYGFADYWNSKSNTMFSRSGLRILQLSRSSALKHWISNIDWYEKYKEESFIVITENLEEKAIIEKFGEPKRTIENKGVEYFIY